MGDDAVTYNAPHFSPDNSGAEARGQQVRQVQAAKKVSNEPSLQAWSLEMWEKNQHIRAKKQQRAAFPNQPIPPELWRPSHV